MKIHHILTALLLTLVFSITPVQAQTTNGLVGYWTFDEGSGTTAGDSAGVNNGTLMNGTTWTTGKVGSALSFDGVDDGVDLGKIDMSGNAMTISLWFKADNLSACNSGSADCRFISKANGSQENNHWWMFSTIESSGEMKLRFRLKTDGVTTTHISTSGTLIDNTWTHVVVLYDGSNVTFLQR